MCRDELHQRAVGGARNEDAEHDADDGGERETRNFHDTAEEEGKHGGNRDAGGAEHDEERFAEAVLEVAFLRARALGNVSFSAVAAEELVRDDDLVVDTRADKSHNTRHGGKVDGADRADDGSENDDFANIDGDNGQSEDGFAVTHQDDEGDDEDADEKRDDRVREELRAETRRDAERASHCGADGEASAANYAFEFFDFE